MNEFKIINKYFSPLIKKNSGAFNLKDDIFYDKFKKLGVTIDTYIEKKHFINFNKPHLVIKKTLRSSLSDLLCKGIIPKYYFFSVAGNNYHLNKIKLQKINSALKQEQRKFNINLAGGDTTHSNVLTLTYCFIGYSKYLPVLRNNAKLNDDIYITNNIGDSFMGLLALKKKLKLNNSLKKYFINKYYLPNLPNLFSKKISLFANSSIDISDGFLQDLNHILYNSNFSANIFFDKIPISTYLKKFLKKFNKDKINYISKGDDYQILFTASKNNRRRIKKFSRLTKTKVSIVGVITKKKSLKSKPSIKNVAKNVKIQGFLHKFR
ncbi:MAG: hypothetical protein CBC24_06635 [Candidatus Pelagibacter sp. TMED64]|nr:thiamine-monophosphate kinase [Candidatus Pelagibacter sp.]OUU64895.1 MAG: hypothetical protein CBC24_06635 [Candidatus Pelagibacter sp. TMED64]|tara:strand:- start:11140 stop:12105 length:966 start_codon:yes stop_codon:yes gene_type:complete